MEGSRSVRETGFSFERLREEKGISQAELAEGLNVTRQAVSNWECGKTEPDIETLHKISDILGITIEELIYGLKRETTVIHNHNTTQNITKKITNGVSFGAALAMVVSYVKWQSIGWAIVHGLLNWVYIVYYIIKYGWS